MRIDKNAERSVCCRSPTSQSGQHVGCKHNCLVLCSYIHAKRENENQSNDFWNKLIDIYFGDVEWEGQKNIHWKK